MEKYPYQEGENRPIFDRCIVSLEEIVGKIIATNKRGQWSSIGIIDVQTTCLHQYLTRAEVEARGSDDRWKMSGQFQQP